MVKSSTPRAYRVAIGTSGQYVSASDALAALVAVGPAATGADVYVERIGRDVVPVRLCGDCTLIIANDDDSGVSCEHGDGDAHRDAMAEHMGDRPGESWAVTCDGEDEHDDFSRRPCDACGTDLAGDRCGGVIMRETRTREDVHYRHPADGLAMCATERTDEPTTTDPARVTCATCRDAD